MIVLPEAALRSPELRAAFDRVTVEHNLDGDEAPADRWAGDSAATLGDVLRAAASALLLELEPTFGEASCSFGVLFADDEEVAALNDRWRGKPSPTNVLSWPAEDVREGDALPAQWGDLAFASGVVSREAEKGGWSLSAYLAHLTVHGLLHCIGHDHEDDDEAGRMETLESRVLARLGLPDPYAD